VLTGLALAGRVGANIAAEIGTMRVTEQIDALETLGYDPFAYLVVPRVLAGRADVPDRRRVRQRDRHHRRLDHGAEPARHVDAGVRARPAALLPPFDVWFSLIKAASFGLAVTSIGASSASHTSGGAAAVGMSTTQAVVVSSMLILVLDAFWAVVLL
jgi:phospholipid/cholesterol/gamma-HCH transport system permease protein